MLHAFLTRIRRLQDRNRTGDVAAERNPLFLGFVCGGKKQYPREQRINLDKISAFLPQSSDGVTGFVLILRGKCILWPGASQRRACGKYAWADSSTCGDLCLPLFQQTQAL